MLYNKMRPHTFDGIIGQETIVKSLRNQSVAEQFFNLYILEGQYGSGKTTTARILALAANCSQKDANGNPCLACEHCKAILAANSSDYMEVDAASNTGVEHARHLIEDVGYMPAFLKKKIYIIDEAHMLSKAAFNSLLKTLEDSPQYAMFILCTTEKDAIPLTIQSRAATYTFRKIPEGTITEYLLKTGRQEYPEHRIVPEALSIISANSDGSMRNALSLLEQAITCGAVTPENIARMLGAVNQRELLSFMSNLISGNIPESIQKVRYFISGGKGLLSLTVDMLHILQDVLVAEISGDVSLICGTSEYCKSIQDLSGLTDSGRLCCMIESTMELRKELRNNPLETVFTCSLIQMCAVERNNNEKTLEKRLEILEQKVHAVPVPDSSEIRKDETDTDTKSVFPEKTEEMAFRITEDETAKTDTFTSEELLMMFGMATPFSELMTSSGKNPCAADKTEKEEPASNAAREIMMRINELKETEPAFCSAVEEGSRQFITGDTVVYRSPLKPVCNLLKKYFEVYNIPSEVCFDPCMEI